jgi:hypothetical protein
MMKPWGWLGGRAARIESSKRESLVEATVRLDESEIVDSAAGRADVIEDNGERSNEFGSPGGEGS